MRRERDNLCVGLCALLLCSSCATYTIPDGRPAEADVPAEFSSHAKSVEMDQQWWLAFKSDELSELVGLVFTNNTSLAKAEARLKQANALAVKSGASRLPEVSVNGSVASTEREVSLIEGGDARSEAAELKLAASYELDLWGRVRAGSRAARLEGDAALEDLRAARISVTSEAVLRYLDLMGVRQKLDTIRAQLKTNRTILELVELRFRRAQATALDVLQQKEALAAVESLVAPLEAHESLLLNGIAVLAGLPAGSDLGLKTRSLPVPPPMPDAGIPVDLLGRRPDVRAARMRLDSSQWRVNVAQADMLPSLRLTGSYGYASSDISALFDNWIAQLAGNLVGPIVDGGRRRAEVRRTEAVVDEKLASYKETVLNSVREVEDALLLEKKQVEHIEALKRQYEAALLTREKATLRYRKGAESYLSVLASLSSGQRLERQIIDAMLSRLSFRVQLYRALAGGWDELGEQKEDSETP